MMENRTEIINYIKRANQNLENQFIKFEELGIELNIFDETYRELENAMSLLIPGAWSFVENDYIDFDTEDLIEIDGMAEDIESISYSGGDKATVELKDGSERIYQRF
ncbi:hypothetical protein [Halobacillus sp. H74]|uniref:hypothetical protein n=1 Tax=Halobacillus sp. H74 TaxID=3457436 RepID=UPI003FCD8395